MPVNKCPLCKTEPCHHSDLLCFDEDYLADMDDFQTDPELRDRIWRCYDHPSERVALGLDGVQYQDKLDRCQRITDKRDKINAEIDANNLRFLRSIGYTGPDISEMISQTLDIEEVTKNCVEFLKDSAKNHKEFREKKSGTVSDQ